MDTVAAMNAAWMEVDTLVVGVVDFQMTVNICRSSHSDNFVQASTYLQTEVAGSFQRHNLPLEGSASGKILATSVCKYEEA